MRSLKRLWERIVAAWREIVDTIAYARDTAVNWYRSAWAVTHAWILDAASESLLFQASGAAEFWSALLTLALAGLLYVPHLAVSATARAVRAYVRRPDLPPVWFGLLGYVICLGALTLATVFWGGAATRLDLGVGIAATMVWVAWINGVLTYYDRLLFHERPASAVVRAILREAWWQEEP